MCQWVLIQQETEIRVAEVGRGVGVIRLNTARCAALIAAVMSYSNSTKGAFASQEMLCVCSNTTASSAAAAQLFRVGAEWVWLS